MQNLFIFVLGFFLSFLGQLPVGTISLTATQIAVQENFKNAWKYAIGVALIEMIYLRIMLSGIRWMIRHKMLLDIYNWITVIFFLILGIVSLTKAFNEKNNQKALLLNNQIDRFILGICLSAVNAAQLPFWIFWSGYFLSMGWLSPGFGFFNMFMVGTGLGTVLGLVVYIYFGNYLVNRMKTSNRTLNIIVGFVFIFAAVIQAYRIIFF
jgi:threonine/homoserine/homoserine lactone efflux protein